MTASTDAAPRAASAPSSGRYYLAMARAVRASTRSRSLVYAAINDHPLSLLPPTWRCRRHSCWSASASAPILLIRPVERFLDGEAAFADIEAALDQPAAAFGDRRRLSATGRWWRCSLLAPRARLSTFGAMHRGLRPGSTRSASFIVGTGFNVRADLLRGQRLSRPACASILFRTRKRQHQRLPRPLPPQGRARPAVRVLRRHDPAGRPTSRATSGARLLREATVDLVAPVVGAA